EQAFLNLTLNAAEAMPDGGQLTVTTRITRPARSTSTLARQIVITFTDTGAGMTESQRRHAFASVLHTTKKKGTGLGLAIVRRVVEAHRGKVEIKSAAARAPPLASFCRPEAENKATG